MPPQKPVLCVKRDGMKLLERLQQEEEEIAKNKWYLSEQAGHDVGSGVAIINWIIHHRSNYNKIANEKTNTEEQPSD